MYAVTHGLARFTILANPRLRSLSRQIEVVIKYLRFHLRSVISFPVESIYAALKRFLQDGETVALATIIEVKGSVPREVGTKMIIHPLGQHVGTIGGGCGEADVIRAALDVIQTGKPVTAHVDLTEAISMESLGVCGGVMNVFIERWGP